MDNVSHVLSPEGWELLNSSDEYFYKIRRHPWVIDGGPRTPPPDRSKTLRDVICQTPSEWATFRGPENDKEAERGRPPPTERLLSIGTNRLQAPVAQHFRLLPPSAKTDSPHCALPFSRSGAKGAQEGCKSLA